MNKKLKIIFFITLVLNVVYITCLAFNVIGSLGWLMFFGESMMTSLFIVFAINHWTQYHARHTRATSNKPLDIFLTVVNEPIDIFEKTLASAVNILYKNKKIYILDDGHRKEIKELSEKYKVIYLSRDTNKDSKAGNLNFGFKNSNGNYLLVLDADQLVTNLNIADELLGYFENDPKLAIVSTRQKFDVSKKDFNHDILFYEHMQTGKNIDNSAISCGSGVFYRRDALNNIGGFQTWNIVEDLYTSYILHSKGYKTLYINKSYTLGTAPLDLSTIYKQRGTWALDTLRIFFKRSPLFHKGLTLKQRSHYFEMGWIYLGSAIAVPVLFILPALTLLLDKELMVNAELYLITRIPSLIILLYFYYRLNDSNSAIGKFWASLFPIYLKALVLALLPIKTKYIVTNKLAGVGKRDISLILPHLLMIMFSVSVITWKLFFFDDVSIALIGITSVWTILMIFWFAPVIQKGFLLE